MLLRVAVVVLVSMAAFPARAQSGLGSDVRSWESREPELSTRAPVVADLLAKPDVLWFSMNVRVDNPDLERALYAARVSTDEAFKAVAAAFPGATLEPRNVTFENRGSSYSKAGGDEVRTLVLESAVAVPLPAGDFWARAGVASRLEKLARGMVASNRNTKPGFVLSIAPAQPRVQDPEKYRAELEKRLLSRAREFAAAASSPGHAMIPAGCSVPGAVAQQVSSLEEAALSLQVGCALQVVGGK